MPCCAARSRTMRDAVLERRPAADTAPSSSSIRPASTFDRSRISLISSSRWRPGVADVPHVLVLPLVELAEHPVEQHVGEADDRVERRAQLVRHARQELGLVPAGDLELRASSARARGTGGRCGWRRPTGSRASRAGRTVSSANAPGGAPAHDERADDLVARGAAGRPRASASRGARSTSRCGSRGRRGRGRAPGAAAAGRRGPADERLVEADAGRAAAPRPARRWCRRPCARGTARVASSYSKIDPPSAPDSSTAWRRSSSAPRPRSRLELTAWLTSPSASSSSTERARSAPRARELHVLRSRSRPGRRTS